MVSHAVGHAKAGEFGRGQVARVGQRVACVVHVQRVATALAIDRQHRPDAVHIAARGRGQTADVHRVGVGPCVDRRGRGDRTDVHRVAAAVRVQLRRARVRARHGKCIVAAAEADLQRLERAVDDLASHTQAAEFGRGQVARVGERVARVIHVQRVAAALAVDRQHRSDAVHIAARGRGQAAHVHRVGVAARVHRGGRGDRADVDRVGAGTGVDRRDAGDRFERDRVATAVRIQLRRAGVRAGHRERVVPATEADLQGLERVEDDLASHAEAVDLGRGQ